MNRKLTLLLCFAVVAVLSAANCSQEAPAPSGTGTMQGSAGSGTPNGTDWRGR